MPGVQWLPDAGDGREGPDPQDAVSVAASAIYDTARDVALFGYRWSWALERRKLPEAAGSPVDASDPDTLRAGYRYVYQYPSGNIGNLEAVYDSGRQAAEPITDGWTRRGAFLYADFTPVWAEYLRDVGEGVYPALFVAGLIDMCASELAMFTSQDPEIANHYRRLYEGKLEQAALVDSQAKPTAKAPVHRLLRARFRGSGYTHVGPHPDGPSGYS